MTCINIREGDALVRVVDLDGCGTPEDGAGGLLSLTNISEFTFEDNITEGDEVTERNLGGKKCYSDVGSDEITNTTVSLTSCGINPALDSLLMGSTSYVDGTVKGYGRKDLSSNTNVVIEVLMRLDVDACDGGGAAPIAAWLFPLVKNWKPNAGTTLNGSDLVKPQYSGKGFQNANLFDSDITVLDKWNSVVGMDPTNEWYGFYLFDEAELDGGDYDALLAAASCTPAALTLLAS